MIDEQVIFYKIIKMFRLSEDDFLNFNKDEVEYVTVITDRATAKRVKLSEFEKTSRAKRGLLLLREVKTNPYRTITALTLPSKEFIGLRNGNIHMVKLTEVAIMDRYSTGSIISKEKISEVFTNVELVKRKDLTYDSSITEMKEEKKVSLKEIDDRLMTIDDFIDIDE